jgi:transposase
MMKAKMMAGGGQNQDGCWRWNDEKRLRRWRCYAHENRPKDRWQEEALAFVGEAGQNGCWWHGKDGCWWRHDVQDEGRWWLNLRKPPLK